jgi:hypothetical protein
MTMSISIDPLAFDLFISPKDGYKNTKIEFQTNLIFIVLCLLVMLDAMPAYILILTNFDLTNRHRADRRGELRLHSGGVP